jgi:hypothetical protein
MRQLFSFVFENVGTCEAGLRACNGRPCSRDRRIKKMPVTCRFMLSTSPGRTGSRGPLGSKKCRKQAPSYFITSSAQARIVAGIVRFKALAVMTFTVNSNLVGKLTRTD